MEDNRKFLYSKEFAIRWDDMDAFNHVNNACYLTYFQECRFEWLTDNNIYVDVNGSGPVVGEITCRYKLPIRYPATIIVELYLKGREKNRVYFEHIIRDSKKQELIYATATVTAFWIDFKTSKSIVVPEIYEKLLAPAIK